MCCGAFPSLHQSQARINPHSHTYTHTLQPHNYIHTRCTQDLESELLTLRRQLAERSAGSKATLQEAARLLSLFEPPAGAPGDLAAAASSPAASTATAGGAAGGGGGGTLLQQLLQGKVAR